MPLLVSGVATAYNVAGDYAQTTSSRTFYPKNYSQDPITISLLFANSLEYDKMVHFVRQHHWDALDTFVDDPNNGTHGTQSQPVEFRLFPYYVSAGRNRRGEPVWREIYGGIPGNFNAASSNGTHVAGYVLSCTAGIERFQFFRTMDLQLKVSYDYLEDQVQGHALTNKMLESNYVKALAPNLYGRKNGKVVPPIPVNPLGQVVAGNPPTDPDSADTMWHNAKLAQIESTP